MHAHRHIAGALALAVAIGVSARTARGQVPAATAPPAAAKKDGSVATGGYTAPRLSDGQPDIRGTWGASPSGTFDLMDPKTGGGRLQELIDEANGKARKAKPSRIIDPPDGKIPYLPWAEAHKQETLTHVDDPIKREHIDPQARCLPGAVPRSFFHSDNMILQPPGFVIFLTQNNHASRIIPLDGRPPLDDRIKLWMGDSRGRWEGHTLVIEVRNQNAKGRFDMVGNFGTDNLYIEERWTIVDKDTLDYRATFYDDKAYSRPWTIAAQAKREKPSAEEYGNEFWEDACHEGERSADHMVLPSAPDAGAR